MRRHRPGLQTRHLKHIAGAGINRLSRRCRGCAQRHKNRGKGDLIVRIQRRGELQRSICIAILNLRARISRLERSALPDRAVRPAQRGIRYRHGVKDHIATAVELIGPGGVLARHLLGDGYKRGRRIRHKPGTNDFRLCCPGQDIAGNGPSAGHRHAHTAKACSQRRSGSDRPDRRLILRQNGDVSAACRERARCARGHLGYLGGCGCRNLVERHRPPKRHSHTHSPCRNRQRDRPTNRLNRGHIRCRHVDRAARNISIAKADFRLGRTGNAVFNQNPRARDRHANGPSRHAPGTSERHCIDLPLCTGFRLNQARGADGGIGDRCHRLASARGRARQPLTNGIERIGRPKRDTHTDFARPNSQRCRQYGRIDPAEAARLHMHIADKSRYRAAADRGRRIGQHLVDRTRASPRHRDTDGAKARRHRRRACQRVDRGFHAGQVRTVPFQRPGISRQVSNQPLLTVFDHRHPQRANNRVARALKL